MLFSVSLFHKDSFIAFITFIAFIGAAIGVIVGIGVIIGGIIGIIVCCIGGSLAGAIIVKVLRSGRKVYCPFCFESIKLVDIQFKCKHCNTGIHRKPSWLEKCGLGSMPQSMPCPTCRKPSTFKFCPNPDCQLDLPNKIAELSDITIAIIGARGVGKTHYIALLIRRIKRLATDFKWALTPLDTETEERYKRDFEDPLFRDHETIPATNPGERIRPLLYSLRLNGRLPNFLRCLNNFLPGWLQLKLRDKRIMLVFFDTAGENLDKDVHEMDEINRYICNAKGIICLLDPLQMRPVRKSLDKKIELPAMNTDTAKVITNVHRLLEHGFAVQGRKMTRNSKVPIPLAIAFSKIDTISAPARNCPSTLLADESSIYSDTRHCGYFHPGDFNNINQEMGTWLKVVDESDDIGQPCKDFEKFAFFGVSALGANPQGGHLASDPEPRRVEDPFLWILWKNKWIGTEGD